MRFDFSVLLFNPVFGEDTLIVTIYGENVANAWNKLIYQFNKDNMFEYVVSILLVDIEDLSNFPFVYFSGDEK